MSNIPWDKIAFAHILLNIWNPEIWHFHPNRRIRNRMALKYRTRGIVSYDRCLTDRLEI